MEISGIFAAMKPFGLKITRLWEWEKTLQDELGGVTWCERVRIITSMIKVATGAILGLNGGAVDKSEWTRRMRCCGKCPIYNKSNRRCRPFKESVLGCGCYMPYAAILKEQCWADDNLPEEGIGWNG